MSRKNRSSFMNFALICFEIIAIAITVLLISSCGRVPVDATATPVAVYPPGTSSPATDTGVQPSATASGQPSETEAFTENETSANETPPSDSTDNETPDASDPSLEPAPPTLTVPDFSLKPKQAPLPTLFAPPASLIPAPGSDSILGTWVDDIETFIFYDDYTYKYTDNTTGAEFTGTYSYIQETGNYFMDFMGNSWFLTVEGDTLTLDNGHHTATLQRQQ